MYDQHKLALDFNISIFLRGGSNGDNTKFTGSIKQIPDDFIVQEICENGTICGDGGENSSNNLKNPKKRTINYESVIQNKKQKILGEKGNDDDDDKKLIKELFE